MASRYIELNGDQYQIAETGRRALTRRMRDSQPTDPSKIVEERWTLSGPVGQSRQREDGFLGQDYSESLETRYDDLLTSLPARTTVTLNTLDLGGTGDSHLGATATLGGFHLGLGTSTLGVADASHIHEDRGQVFVARGQFISQVRPDTMALVETEEMPQRVEGMVFWQGQGYVGVGPNETLRRRTTVSASGSSYATVGSIEAGTMVATLKHCFYVDRRSANENEMRFTLDNFATESNAFQVHDTGQTPNGMGSYGGTALLGFSRGIHGFSSSGDPVEVITTARDFPSTLNGKQHATLWGWHYTTTALGLKATIPGEVENNVGPGDIRGFEGPTGQPQAIFAFKDSLFLCELVGSDSYCYRGDFDPQTTPGTGRPKWYPFGKITGSTITVFGATTGRTLPTLLDGEDSDRLGYTSLSVKAREIDDTNYTYSTNGGTWFGSTRMGRSLRANPRWASFQTENCTASANTWQLAMAVDEGSYINVGSAVVSNGNQVVFPVSAGAPLATLDGYNHKPRLTQVAASSSAPPQIRGDLTILFDVRPDQVEEIALTVELGGQGKAGEEEFDLLAGMVDPKGTGATPIAVVLPDEVDTIYGFVHSVERNEDITGDGVVAANITLLRWDTA